MATRNVFIKLTFVILYLTVQGLFMMGLSQELRAQVQVVAQGIQGTNRSVFDAMQVSIMELMNEQQWTEHRFSPQERIECRFLITIREVIGTDEFRATLQVQSQRPVFGSSYSTTMVNYLDQNFSFHYNEHEPLIFNINNLESNLVSVLAYYAYIIIGYDYDSFSSRGGTPFFQRAEQIVAAKQNARESGWRSFESQRNRYWLVENLLSEQHVPLRNSYYTYHRRGLDQMAEKTQDGRSEILSSLEQLQRLHRQRPNSFALTFFFDAKREELINIFSQSPSMEKGRVVNLLKEMDPAQSNRYDEILSERR